MISPDGQSTFTLVLRRDDWPLFDEAMSLDVNAMEKNETSEDAELLDGRKHVGYLWTFTIKLVYAHRGLPKCMAWITWRLSRR